MRRVSVLVFLGCLVASALYAAPSSASHGVKPAEACTDVAPADPTGVLMSDNIRLKCVLPNPGVIGAHFRGNTMFVTSVTGLTSWNISNPRAPKQLGFLALPHFENEDVDLGGNILMISNDAAESRGLLYLIDIRDPENLKPIYDLPAIGSYPFDMGGYAGIGGPGHTASCVLNCKFAWVTDGGSIRVYDLRAAQTGDGPPDDLGLMDAKVGGLAVHDVQKDGNGLYWVAGFEGTAAFRVPINYEGPGDEKMVMRTNAEGESTYEEELGLGDGSGPNDYIHHNSRRLKNKGVVYITEEDYTRPGCRGAGSFQTWKMPTTANGQPDSTKRMKFMDQWQTELLADTANLAGMCSAHYFDVSNNMVAQGWYEQGTRFLDVSKPDKIRQVGYYIPPRTMSWSAYFAPTDETRKTVYALDAAHGIDVLVIDRPAKGALSAPKAPCTTNACRKANLVPSVKAPIKKLWRANPDVNGTNGFRFENGYYGWTCRLRGAGPLVPPVLTPGG